MQATTTTTTTSIITITIPRTMTTKCTTATTTNLITTLTTLSKSTSITTITDAAPTTTAYAQCAPNNIIALANDGNYIYSIDSADNTLNFLGVRCRGCGILLQQLRRYCGVGVLLSISMGEGGVAGMRR